MWKNQSSQCLYSGLLPNGKFTPGPTQVESATGRQWLTYETVAALCQLFPVSSFLLQF